VIRARKGGKRRVATVERHYSLPAKILQGVFKSEEHERILDMLERERKRRAEIGRAAWAEESSKFSIKKWFRQLMG
jgi:hypothetical protein